MSDAPGLPLPAQPAPASPVPAASATPTERFDPGTLSIGAVIGALICAVVGTAFGLTAVTYVAAITLACVAVLLSCLSAGAPPIGRRG